MKKIAFLFVTIDDIHFPTLWSKYFSENKDKYTIYIHPKYPEKVTVFKDKIIKNLVDTSWGFITRAYLELFKAAIQDKDNYKFITLSESCVPIQSFNKFYKAVMNSNNSWIKLIEINMYKKSNTLKGIKGLVLHHYSRCCLNRDHVKQLLVNRKELEQFHNMHVGDEYYLSILLPIINVDNFDVIYDDWEYTKENSFKIKSQIKKLYNEQEKNNNLNNMAEIDGLKKKYEYENAHPKQLINVEEDLQKIKKCKSYFYRKFPKNSNIKNYWKEIIKYHDRHK